MIAGIGTDIVSIARMQEAIDRWGMERFARRVLTDTEYHLLVEQNRPGASYLAKRFAAKEAAVKALGTGFRDGISLKHIEVVNNELGKPVLGFSGKAEQLANARQASISHVSLSDEEDYAIAFVVLESASA